MFKRWINGIVFFTQVVFAKTLDKWGRVLSFCGRLNKSIAANVLLDEIERFRMFLAPTETSRVPFPIKSHPAGGNIAQFHQF